MNRIRIFLVAVLAIGAGGALAYGTYNYLQNVPVRTVTVPTRAVVVAESDLKLGSEITADDVRTVQWPADAVPEGTFETPEAIVGRGLIASVVRHEAILGSKLAPEGAGSGLPPVIRHGMRAVSVRVNDVISVAGYVLPGNRVDVLATATPTSDREDTTSKVILTNVEVLAAGTKLEQEAEQGEPMNVSVVTLLVTPDQAEKLALASTEGKIQLALRNPADDTAPETPGVKPAMLLGMAAKPAVPSPAPRPARVSTPEPAAPAPAAPTVEIIRGDQRATEVIN